MTAHSAKRQRRNAATPDPAAGETTAGAGPRGAGPRGGRKHRVKIFATAPRAAGTHAAKPRLEQILVHADRTPP